MLFCSRCGKVGCRGFNQQGDYPNYNWHWYCVAPDKEIPAEAHAAFAEVYDRFFERLERDR